jgi:hypothetical protein
MHAAIAATFLLAQAVPAAPAAGAATPGPACLPDAGGYLRARLRGDLEARVDWRADAVECAGMSRPGAQGLRVRFSGALPDGRRVGLLFAAPTLAEGASARGVPVNLTVIVEGATAVYGTQGTDRCLLDEVRQTPLMAPGVAPRSFRIDGRGYCTGPAKAVTGPGSILVTSFDFAGMVVFAEDDGAAPAAADREPRS